MTKRNKEGPVLGTPNQIYMYIVIIILHNLGPSRISSRSRSCIQQYNTLILTGLQRKTSFYYETATSVLQRSDCTSEDNKLGDVIQANVVHVSKGDATVSFQALLTCLSELTRLFILLSSPLVYIFHLPTTKYGNYIEREIDIFRSY